MEYFDINKYVNDFYAKARKKRNLSPLMNRMLNLTLNAVRTYNPDREILDEMLGTIDEYLETYDAYENDQDKVAISMSMNIDELVKEFNNNKIPDASKEIAEAVKNEKHEPLQIYHIEVDESRRRSLLDLVNYVKSNATKAVSRINERKKPLSLRLDDE